PPARPALFNSSARRAAEFCGGGLVFCHIKCPNSRVRASRVVGFANYPEFLPQIKRTCPSRGLVLRRRRLLPPRLLLLAGYGQPASPPPYSISSTAELLVLFIIIYYYYYYYFVLSTSPYYYHSLEYGPLTCLGPLFNSSAE